MAYLVYMGDIVDENFEVSDESIGFIEMPNKNDFLIPDPRPDLEQTNFMPCMKNCDAVTNVIGRARDLDVTPEDES